MNRIKLVILMLLGAAGPWAMAADKVIQFTADAVQITPDRGTMQTKIYVGKDAVRNEYQVNGQTFIEIVRQKNRDRIVINPARKEYVIQPGGNVSLPVSNRQRIGETPCAGVANVTCRMLGKEQINGRMTEKWEFIQNVNGRELRSLHWIDSKKRFPIRQMFPDGTVSEMKLLGSEERDGRKVEKWEVIMTRPDGQQMRSLQWHDSELDMAIREELPGGYVRELRNIRPGKQPARLFEIPEGYREVRPPRAPVQASGGAMSGNSPR